MTNPATQVDSASVYSERQLSEDNPNSNASPNFVYSGGVLGSEYFSDWICELSRANADRIKKATDKSNDFLTIESVQFLFTVCVRLRLPHDVRYAAALIFDNYRFMLTHTQQVDDFMNHLKMNPRRLQREKEKIITNMSRQMTLRIATAIQIATKNHNYHDSLSSHQICGCLRTLGYAYTPRAVLKSELRIVKTLKYKLPGSPIQYAETLLKILAKTLDTEKSIIWQHVQLFLDIVFLHHERVYTIVLKRVLGDKYPSISKLECERVKADWMLLGCGLVAAAINCIKWKIDADMAVTELAITAGTPKTDILSMAMGIIETVMALEREAEIEKEAAAAANRNKRSKRSIGSAGSS